MVQKLPRYETSPFEKQFQTEYKNYMKNSNLSYDISSPDMPLRSQSADFFTRSWYHENI